MTLGQPSQPEGDKLRTRAESAASNVQEQAENIERQQATKQLAAGEANKPVNDDNNEKKRLGKSRATNKLIDENGRGLASAQDLLGAAAHMTLTSDVTEEEIQRLGKQYESQREMTEKPILLASSDTASAKTLNDAPNATPSETPQQRKEREEQIYQELVKNPIVGEPIQDHRGTKKDKSPIAIDWDSTGETAPYGRRPIDFPEHARGSKPFVDTGRITEPTKPESWTLPTRENYSGWVPGDPINPMTWSTDSSLYIQQIMKQNFIVNANGKRVAVNDESVDSDFRYKFGNAARHAVGVGDLVFNHGMDSASAENGMWLHEPPGMVNSLFKSVAAGSLEPFDKEKADSDADVRNNHYAATKVSSFRDFESFAKQMLADSWTSASKGSRIIDESKQK